MDFSLLSLEVAAENLHALQRTFARSLAGKRPGCKDAEARSLNACINHFFSAMDSDFDTARAILAVFELADILEKKRVMGKARSKLRRAVQDYQRILGLSLGI
jgi:cysteinyl-tRNA synthetase